MSFFTPGTSDPNIELTNFSGCMKNNYLGKLDYFPHCICIYTSIHLILPFRIIGCGQTPCLMGDLAPPMGGTQLFKNHIFL